MKFLREKPDLFEISLATVMICLASIFPIIGLCALIEVVQAASGVCP